MKVTIFSLPKFFYEKIISMLYVQNTIQNSTDLYVHSSLNKHFEPRLLYNNLPYVANFASILMTDF
jgi:hypothetical protein